MRRGKGVKRAKEGRQKGGKTPSLCVLVGLLPKLQLGAPTRSTPVPAERGGAAVSGGMDEPLGSHSQRTQGQAP